MSDPKAPSAAVTNVRAIFLSDIHLGTRGCQAALLLEFLRHYEADMVYLVGDIVDGWRLKRSWHWPQAHNDVVQKLLRKGRKGARIIYVPGNHDEFLRDFVGSQFGVVELADTCIHEGLNGRNYLVIHGDKFDMVVRHAPWLAALGDSAYTVALGVNTALSMIRRRMGLPYWSLSAWAKLKVKNAVSFIGDYEATLVHEAHREGVDGVICGHIHHAASHDLNGIHYMNTGDWVESCTAIVEHLDGRFELIEWSKQSVAPVISQPKGALVPA
jgi:UDP-2,3-diacylglucosamine pyrophosphatase LpxH